MRTIQMERSIIKIVMIVGILQVLCFPSYGCDPTVVQWEATYVDGEPVYFYKDVVVRPGQYILFKAHLDFSNGSSAPYRKVNFRFTKIDSQDEAFYEETDMTIPWICNTMNTAGDAQVGIHWKVDGKITKPGRYRVDVQAPYQNPSLRKCTESSNVISREVVFDPGNTPEEFEVEDED
ncbi:MAG: hypothetical protein CSYNP_02629 [Syntrophus sp. SKADARSKE-3]|nr:hypothetical protein [Syntrophus sp. SKADARSKE-3]